MKRKLISTFMVVLLATNLLLGCGASYEKYPKSEEWDEKGLYFSGMQVMDVFFYYGESADELIESLDNSCESWTYEYDADDSEQKEISIEKEGTKWISITLDDEEIDSFKVYDEAAPYTRIGDGEVNYAKFKEMTERDRRILESFRHLEMMLETISYNGTYVDLLRTITENGSFDIMDEEYDEQQLQINLLAYMDYRDIDLSSEAVYSTEQAKQEARLYANYYYDYWYSRPMDSDSEEAESIEAAKQEAMEQGIWLGDYMDWYLSGGGGTRDIKRYRKTLKEYYKSLEISNKDFDDLTPEELREIAKDYYKEKN